MESCRSALIIGQDPATEEMLERLLAGLDDEFNIAAFGNSIDALHWLEWHKADLIVAETAENDSDCFDWIRKARASNNGSDASILLVSAIHELQFLDQALDAGASDFLLKPFNEAECFARCRNLLTQQRQFQIIQERAHWLERQVAEATNNIRNREQETLLRLAKAGEYRDEETGNHVLRMAKYARVIAETMGMSDDECRTIELAAPMHDIGKIGIPDSILLKPGKLTDAEFNVMKTHTIIGYNILKGSPSEFLQTGAVIALRHHEKFDGSGYPHGLAGEDIPLSARIVALADAYDALTSVRPYKAAWPAEQAIELIQSESGSHFDPACVEAFTSQIDRLLRIQHLLADPKESRSA